MEWAGGGMRRLTFGRSLLCRGAAPPRTFGMASVRVRLSHMAEKQTSRRVDGMSGVQIGPGATALARNTFLGQHLRETRREVMNRPLVIALANNVGLGTSELIDAVLMMQLPGFMCGIAALER